MTRILFLLKADQLGLFDTATMQAGYVNKHGTFVAPAATHRKKRAAPKPQTGDLFGAGEDTSKPARDALTDYIAKKGGSRRIASMLDGLTGEQRAQIIGKMAAVGKTTAADVEARLKEPVTAPAVDDLFSQPEPVAKPDAPKRPATDFKYFSDFAKDRTGGIPAIGTAEHAELKAEWDAKAAAPEAKPAADVVKMRELRDTLKDMIETKRERGETIPQAWTDKIAEADKVLGPEEKPEKPAEEPAPDTSGWSEAKKRANDLYLEYKRRAVELMSDKKARAAFVAKVRAAARKTPIDDDHAVTRLDGLAVKLDIGNLETRKGELKYAEARPKEGDVKTEDGIEYQLKGGRWHKITQEIAENPQKQPANADESENNPEYSEDSAREQSDMAAANARAKQAAKLRTAAAKVIETADLELNRDRLTNTHKRASQASSAIQQAERARAIGVTMGNLADAIESGEAKHLSAISTKAAVETLENALQRAVIQADAHLSYHDSLQRRGRPPEPPDLLQAKLPVPGIHGDIARSYVNDLRKIKQGKLADWLESRISGRDDKVALPIDKAKEIVAALNKAVSRDIIKPWHVEGDVRTLDRFYRIGIKTDLDLRLALAEFAMFREGARKEDPIKKMEQALIGLKIPGYFPTPTGIVDDMIERAGIKPGMRVLEPSAGKGNIADKVRAAGVVPDVIEISHTLRGILQAKGYTMAGDDFTAIEPLPVYDAIVMNPPFENGQDMEHVRRAYSMLKPGGTLVSIMGEGAFFRSDSKATNFREWLDSVDGEHEKLPEGSFMSSERQTGVNTRMVVIRKPEGVDRSEVVRMEHELAEDKFDLAESLRHEPNAPETRELVQKVHEAEAKIQQAKEVGPREGDTKIEDGINYVLRDGRWHRADDDQPGFTPERINATNKLLTLKTKIDEMGGRQRVGEIFRMAKQNPDYKMQADSLIRKLGESVGLSRDEVLAELGLKETVKTVTKTPEAKSVEPVNPGGEFSDMDPNSPNYKFRDTGYIAGSRKEYAANAIKAAAAMGLQNTYNSIQWEELEANPRQAKEMITKSNLFGKVNWDRLKDGGMDPGAGFLVDRIYASIGTEPGEDSPQARKDYALGLETLRTRLEKCLTPEDVTTVLGELREEFDGGILNSEESARFAELSAARGAIWQHERELREQSDALYQAWSAAKRPFYDAKYAQDKRERRGWKPDPELTAQMEAAKPAMDAAEQTFMDWRAAHPEMTVTSRNLGGGWSAQSSDIGMSAREMGTAMDMIVAGARLRNKVDNPLHRAWQIMGDRFVGVLRYSSNKGSEAFGKHVATAKAGHIKDWSWAEKEIVRTKGATKESARFQMRVAESYTRTGGRKVDVDSTATLKAKYGLRDVQSGNWVLRDVNSAKFHVENTAAAFSDMADVIGFPDDIVSMNGRLAMAFGARGKGSTGWAETAASAHYEPVQRVINLTKMGGGGSLAHEWFHALDNMLKEFSGAGDSGKGDYASVDPKLLADTDLRGAMQGLAVAMTAGSKRRQVSIPYSDKDYRTAKYNLDNPVNMTARGIVNAGNLESALDHIDKTFSGRDDKKNASRRDGWKRIAAAWYDGNAAGGKAQAPHGPQMSDFQYQAHVLDSERKSPHYAMRHEMAARAFQAWIEDSLGAQGRQNDYLSAYADNKHHVCPLTGFPWKPFPEGEERKRINAAFDNLFAVLRDKKAMLKAMSEWAPILASVEMDDETDVLVDPDAE